MRMRHGVLPTILGGVVTAAGITAGKRDMYRRGMSRRDAVPLVEAGIIGYGLAHIVLGSIRMNQHR